MIELITLGHDMASTVSSFYVLPLSLPGVNGVVVEWISWRWPP